MQKTILIVEDESALRHALVAKFTQEDFLVHEARDGLEGLEKARIHKPDLILLDIVMPRMDGLSMMDEVRKEVPWGSTVPIMLLSNLNVDDAIDRGIAERKPAFYLVKSDWKLSDVVSKVRELLSPTDLRP